MKLGVVMDPIRTIKPQHDSTFAMLLEVFARKWSIFYFEPQDLFLQNGKAYGEGQRLKVFDHVEHWFSLQDRAVISLDELDFILMRKDPPFNEEYLYLTQLLDRTKALVVNNPQALRDANEKLVITTFPSCCVPTLVSSKIALLKAFWKEEKDIVCKPMHAMGGNSIFHLSAQDPNAAVVFEILTQQETCHVMAQRFIPEIKNGDKRILLIGGEPIPFALARIPQSGEWRGNMALGAKPQAQPLTTRDIWICQQLAPYLRDHGIYFAGIDVIGDYLTEINITSPTCIRELDTQCHLNISAQLLNYLEKMKL